MVTSIRMIMVIQWADGFNWNTRVTAVGFDNDYAFISLREAPNSFSRCYIRLLYQANFRYLMDLMNTPMYLPSTP